MITEQALAIGQHKRMSFQEGGSRLYIVSKERLEPMPQGLRARTRVPEAAVVREAVHLVEPTRSVHSQPTSDELLRNVWRVGVGETEPEAGISLAQRIREDPAIKKVKVLGPPGVGKTTFIEQLIDGLFSMAGEEIAVRVHSFDPVFQQMMKHTPRELWNKYHWQFINDSLLVTSKERIRETSRVRRIRPLREIQIDEVPFVGRNSKTNNDRGRSFVENELGEARRNGDANGIVYVSLASYPTTVEKTAQTRDTLKTALQTAKTTSEKLKILARFGIEIADATYKKSKKRLETLINAFLKQVGNSASPKQMTAVAEDFREEMREVLPRFSNMSGVLDTFIDLPPDLRLSHDQKFQLQREIYYWEQTFDSMGIPSDQRYILVNPPLSRVHRKVLSKAA